MSPCTPDHLLGINQLEIFRLFKDQVDLDISESLLYQPGNFHTFHGDAESLEWFLRNSDSPHTIWSLEKCVKVALMLCCADYQLHAASMLRVVLNGRKIDKYVCSIHDENNGTLLDYLVYHLSDYYPHFPANYQKRLEDGQPVTKAKLCLPADYHRDHDTQLSTIICLTQELVWAGSSLHRASSRPISHTLRTPLLHILAGSFRESQLVSSTQFHTPAPVLLWLQILASCGIDLIKYGMKEQALHRIGEAELEFDFYPAPSLYRTQSIQLRLSTSPTVLRQQIGGSIS